MIFDVRQNITYQELDSWIGHVQDCIGHLNRHRVMVSLPVSSEAMACYLASWNVVAAITTEPLDEPSAAEFIKHWDCSAALVSFEPSANGRAILPGVWLWEPEIDSTVPKYVPGMGMLTSGTTGTSKLIMLPHDQFVRHWQTGEMCKMFPEQGQITWLGIQLWTDWGFVNAWGVYQTRSKCILEQFHTGREVLCASLDHCDIIHYGSTLYKLSKYQPMRHGKIYVSGPNLSHHEKMRGADIMGIPVFNHYGSTEAGCVSTQSVLNWTKPGAGVPALDFKIIDGVFWVKRLDDDQWWCMHDQVRLESDGQISIIGRSNIGRVRTAAGMIDLNSTRDFLLQQQLITDGEFVVVNQNEIVKVMLVYSGSNISQIKQALKKLNRNVNFVDWFVHDTVIQRTDIGKIKRQLYLDQIENEK